MEIILAVLAFLFLLAGLLGSVVPAIPGPPLSYAGLLILKWSGYANFSVTFLLVWAAITIAVTIMDNFLPALMTKRFGGSRLAVIGSVLGLIAGTIFFAPAGLIAGPFLGALAGELINNSVRRKKIENSVPETDVVAHNNNALKVALGAFLAFILGTGAKLITGSLMIYYAVRAVL
jgi:uncharacterized protein YqgC (DUF456 family)